MGFFKKLAKGDIGGIVNDAVKDVGGIVTKGGGGSSASSSEVQAGALHLAISERYKALGGKMDRKAFSKRPADANLWAQAIDWVKNTSEGQARYNYFLAQLGGGVSSSVIKDVSTKVVTDALSGAGDGLLGKVKDFANKIGNSLTKGLGGSGADLLDNTLKAWWQKHKVKVLLIGLPVIGVAIWGIFFKGKKVAKIM